MATTVAASELKEIIQLRTMMKL